MLVGILFQGSVGKQTGSGEKRLKCNRRGKQVVDRKKNRRETSSSGRQI